MAGQLDKIFDGFDKHFDFHFGDCIVFCGKQEINMVVFERFRIGNSCRFVMGAVCDQSSAGCIKVKWPAIRK